MSRRAALFVLVAAGLAACARAPDEAALREALAGIQAGLENRSRDEVLDRLTEDFTAGNGMGRDELRRFLALQFLRNASVGATLGPVEVKIDGERAETRFQVLMTGGEVGWLPSRAGGYRVEAGWRIESGEWKLEWVRWEG